MVKLFSIPALALSLAAISGCAEVDSADIKTSGIYSEMSVSAEDDSTTVFVRLRTGRPLDADTIILSEGDQLSATMAGAVTSLLKNESDAYEGSFSAAPAGAEVKVALSRAQDPGAPDSVVTLPESFEITAPDFAETFNAGESITVAWSPASPSGSIDVTYRINCRVFDDNGLPSGANYGRSYKTDDSGTHTAQINDVLNVLGNQDDLESGISCPLEVTVTRTNEGTLDAALTKGGDIKATREKSVVVNVIP